MKAKKILVATDFSERSDRAFRRALLQVTAWGASLVLLHVIDDDQPKRLFKAEHAAAAKILSEQMESLRAIEHIECEARITQGEAFQGIGDFANETGADMVVIGPHRRSVLMDVFVGTTAERTIRTSHRPVLMVNGVPAGPYRHVLIAVDFSDCSAEALQAVKTLGLDRNVVVSVLHVFDAPAAGLMSRSSANSDDIEDYISDRKGVAARELDTFLNAQDFFPTHRILEYWDNTPAHSINRIADNISADLIVVGTHGRTGIGKWLLGSVAEAVLRDGRKDVLAVPPRDNATASE